MRRRLLLFFVVLSLCVLSSPLVIQTPVSAGQNASDDKFVYADFEKQENGRAVSNGGGLIQIFGGQQLTPVQFKGMANSNPGAPELVHIKQGDTNHLASFEYTLTIPNQWANVTLEIQGHPTKDGQTTPDDVSGDKDLSLQLYADKAEYVRVEFISHGQGIMLDFGFPQTNIKIKPGLNTYVIPLKSIQQPGYAQLKVNSKDVLKKLTAVSISTFCNQCLPQHGTVVVDNVVFEK